MVQKKAAGIVVIALVAVVASAGLYVYFLLPSVQDDPDAEDPIIDMAGRTINLPEDFDRILAIGPGALRFVSYFDKGDMVVATENRESAAYNAKSYMYANPWYNSSEIQKIGNSPWTDLESIIALDPRPQVLISVDYEEILEGIQILEAANITVVCIKELQSALDPLFAQQVRLLGRVFGEEQRGEDLLTHLNATISDLSDRVSGIVDKPSVYIGAIAWAGTRTFTWSTCTYAPFDLISANNVITANMTLSDVPMEFDFETIVGLDPDFVFIDPTGFHNVRDDYNTETVKYDALSAFNTSDWNVHMTIPFIWYGVNFDNSLAAAYQIGKLLYPAQFADVNVTAMANEIFQTWVGVECYGAMDAWFVNNPLRQTSIDGPADFSV